MNATRSQEDRPAGERLVVELAGLAGAGKSTISRALLRQGQWIRLEVHPYFRQLKQLSFFLRGGLALLPTLIQLKGERGRWFTRRELAWMMIVAGWCRSFERRPLERGVVHILDQGAIYMLAQLYAFGPERLQCIKAEKWWRKVFDRWAGALDLVIWLDAPENILLKRIRARSEPHLVKDWPDSEALVLLRRYRMAYEQVLTELAVSRAGPRVLWLDTAQTSVAETMEQVLQFLETVRNADA